MKDYVFAVIFIVAVMLWFIGGFYVVAHDENILEHYNNEAKMQYFIQSDNLTNQEQYNLALSICNETFSNESLFDKLYGPKTPFWDIERHKKYEIDRCKCRLLNI